MDDEACDGPVQRTPARTPVYRTPVTAQRELPVNERRTHDLLKVCAVRSIGPQLARQSDRRRGCLLFVYEGCGSVKAALVAQDVGQPRRGSVDPQPPWHQGIDGAPVDWLPGNDPRFNGMPRASPDICPRLLLEARFRQQDARGVGWAVYHAQFKAFRDHAQARTASCQRETGVAQPCRVARRYGLIEPWKRRCEVKPALCPLGAAAEPGRARLRWTERSGRPGGRSVVHRAKSRVNATPLFHIHCTWGGTCTTRSGAVGS